MDNLEIASDMIANHDKYFDEAYFQRGEERGTAYRDYAKSADDSLTFREVAEALAFVFRPTKCLEIGCATGAIVRNLNQLGIEAHGIDVSEWAVRNKLHENVIRAGADDLPFSDGDFDLVYSSHSLEHIPPDIIDRAFIEIDRVSARAGHHFHMLPIVGTYPYDCDHDVARSNLRTDPTHNILEPMEWWRSRWGDLGWRPLEMNICFFNDTNGAELSSGQFTLTRHIDQDAALSRAFEWNQRIHRKQFLRIEQFKREMTKPRPIGSPGASFSEVIGEPAEWCDYEYLFQEPISVKGATLELMLDLGGDEVRPLRMALIDDSNPSARAVIEFWAEFRPGISAIRVPIDEFRVLEGKPNLDQIDKFFFGGRLGDAGFRIMATLSSPHGVDIQMA